MAGEARTPRPATERYKRECRELAESLGWDERRVFGEFEQIAWMFEVDHRWPRSCAEWLARRYVQSIFDKRGVQPS